MLKKYTSEDIKKSKKCSKCGKKIKISYVGTNEDEILCKACKENTNDE